MKSLVNIYSLQVPEKSSFLLDLRPYEYTNESQKTVDIVKNILVSSLLRIIMQTQNLKWLYFFSKLDNILSMSMNCKGSREIIAKFPNLTWAAYIIVIRSNKINEYFGTKLCRSVPCWCPRRVLSARSLIFFCCLPGFRVRKPVMARIFSFRLDLRFSPKANLLILGWVIEELINNQQSEANLTFGDFYLLFLLTVTLAHWKWQITIFQLAHCKDLFKVSA